MAYIEKISPTPDECGDCLEKIVSKKRRKRKSRKFHKWIGIIITLPLLWVTITGVILNHTVDWKLDQKNVENEWLKSHYGMAPDGDPMASIIDSSERPLQVIEWDGVIYYNSIPITTSLEGKLLGALNQGSDTAPIICIVTEYNVLQLTPEGEVIEKLDELSLPELPLTAVAQQADKLYLKNAAGWHTPDADWLEMTAVAPANAPLTSISLSTIENQQVRDKLQKNWSRAKLPMSRVILDLHSGRFFGTVGKYLYDLVSLCIIIITLTGVILFFRAKNKKSKRRKLLVSGADD